MNKFKLSTNAFVHNVCATNNSQIFTHICDVIQIRLIFFCNYYNQKQPRKKTIQNQNEKIRALDIRKTKKSY